MVVKGMAKSPESILKKKKIESLGGSPTAETDDREGGEGEKVAPTPPTKREITLPRGKA